MRIHICNSKCFCCFVPPFVTENLAKAGVEPARESLLKSRELRQKRAAKTEKKRKKAESTGTSAREVYDSQHKEEQRVQLVRSEGAPVTVDEDVTKVYEYSGLVRDYFKSLLGRNSIDNLGMDLILNVHFGELYMNAFWDGDEMTFGDGDGQIFSSFAKSLDVIAHELAHGVTQHTASLEYYSQSGALNEHFSDVFGTAITQFALKQTAGEADWLIGDEIMGPELYGEALRSMKEPGTAYDNSLLGKDIQPGHMKDYFQGEEDNQGVHINSGIPNKAFYLTAIEIGTDKATLIWYTALQKLWATANFNDAVTVIVDSTRLLIKSGQVPVGSTQIVRSAFKAVGLPSS
ncbi:M4 family metallopeptidase [Calothrix sp. NIES-2098]|uniref:M4 family metallopeptidase n=1 Tax=Calothrix sp. NIES-2098 TaxID=1954171 RepID=UPI000B5E639C|nr:peptidase M4, thermolysin [Calothrix sp. NIES-2098]